MVKSASEYMKQRKPGRPKKKRTSRQTVTAKPSEVKLIRDEEQHVTQNTDKWRGPVLALCPTGDEEIQVR